MTTEEMIEKAKDYIIEHDAPKCTCEDCVPEFDARAKFMADFAMSVNKDSLFDFGKIEVNSPLFRNITSEACIEFGKWYSGMDGIKVRNAYKRFRKEVYSEIQNKDKCTCGKSHIMHEELDNRCDNCNMDIN